jgi:hypothetical protein
MSSRTKRSKELLLIKSHVLIGSGLQAVLYSISYIERVLRCVLGSTNHVECGVGWDAPLF